VCEVLDAAKYGRPSLTPGIYFLILLAASFGAISGSVSSDPENAKVAISPISGILVPSQAVEK
jgi:hypothetical protein